MGILSRLLGPALEELRAENTALRQQLADARSSLAKARSLLARAEAAIADTMHALKAHAERKETQP